jgi:hypothetical protein
VEQFHYRFRVERPQEWSSSIIDSEWSDSILNSENKVESFHFLLASYQVHKAAAMHKCTNGTLAIDI